MHDATCFIGIRERSHSAFYFFGFLDPLPRITHCKDRIEIYDIDKSRNKKGNQEFLVLRDDSEIAKTRQNCF